MNAPFPVTPAASIVNGLSVDVEDWFQVGAVPGFRKTRRPFKGDRLTRVGRSEVVPPDADLPLPL